MKTLRLVLMICLSPLLKAEAQEGGSSTARELTLEELDTGTFRPGDRVTFMARYTGLQGKLVVFLGTAVRFQIEDADVRRAILNATINNANLAVEAVCAGTEPPTPLFTVEEVKSAPSDLEVFKRDIETLKSRGAEKAELLFSLANRIVETQEELKVDGLRQVARQACSEGLHILEAALGPGDVESRLRLVRRMYSIFPDRVFAMELLAILERKYPEHDPIREFLLSLNARKFRGRWMTYEEFKQSQGFVQHEGDWIHERERAFREEIAHFRESRRDDLILRNRLEEEYAMLANRGETARGMTAEEIHNALGYADRVYRKRVGEKDYDLWIYEDRRCYFCDGVLFKDSSWEGGADSQPQRP